MINFKLIDKNYWVDGFVFDKKTEYVKVYLEEDVKEFIRLLKIEIKEGVQRNNILPLDWCFDRIDKLAGDKLK